MRLRVDTGYVFRWLDKLDETVWGAFGRSSFAGAMSGADVVRSAATNTPTA